MAATPPRFSPDGTWFWTGTEWRTALSPDRRWRWDGYRWVPYQAPSGGGGAAAGITIGIVAGVFVVVLLVAGLVTIVLYTMGTQIANVFSNVAAALGATPSP